MRSIQKPNPALPPQEFAEQVSALWPQVKLRTLASSTTLSSDSILLVSATTNVVLTLPRVSQAGSAAFYVCKADSTANTLTVSSAAAAEGINGSASYSIVSQYVWAQLVGDHINGRWIAFRVVGA